MVFYRKRLQGGKPSPRRLTNKGQSGPAGGKGARYGLKRRRKGIARILNFQSNVPRKRLSAHDFYREKSVRRTTGMEVANPTSTSQAPAPGLEGEASARHEPDVPPMEDADRLSATKYEVESTMNHRCRRTVFRDACFSPEALNTFVLLKMVLPEPLSSM